MNILVTGGAGFIGRNLVESLLNYHKVRIYDNLSNSSEENISFLIENGADFVKGDVLDYEKLVKSSKGYDIVIHLAAKSDVADSVNNPENTINVNVNGTINVVNACKENKIKKIIFASSAAVYGDCNDIITEKTKTNPMSPYGKSKIQAEEEIKKNANGINYIILRMFNVYGKGQNNQYAGVITKFQKNISENKEIIIYGNGEQTRDFISISDVVNAFSCAIKSDKNGTYNIASGTSISINELAKIMFNVLGNKVEIRYSDKQIGDIEKSIVSISLAKDELHFIAKRELVKEISSIYHE